MLKFLSTKPPLTKPELEQRGHSTIADARAWRQAFSEAAANPRSRAYKLNALQNALNAIDNKATKSK